MDTADQTSDKQAVDSNSGEDSGVVNGSESDLDHSPIIVRPAGSRTRRAAIPSPPNTPTNSNEEPPPPSPAPASAPEPAATFTPSQDEINAAIAPAPISPWIPGGQLSATEAGGQAEQSPDDLPLVAPEADLARLQLPRRWAIFCFALTLFFYLLFVPKVLDYSSPPTGDQPFYMMVTLSLVQDGDLNLYNNHQNRDEDKFYSLAPHGPGFVGTSAPYPLPPQLAGNSVRPPTEWYNSHMPGLSFLMVPAWIIGSWFSLWWPAVIVFMCIVGALVSQNVFMLAYEQTGKLWIALAVWAAMAFSNPIMTYSYMIFSELATGLLLIYAFRRLALGWGANGPGRLLLVGACIGYIPWLAWRCLPIAACIGIYAIVQWWRHYRAHRAVPEGGRNRWFLAGVGRFLPRTLFFLAPIVVAGVLICWYNLFIFGMIIQQDRVPERGDAPIFLWPWQGREELTHFAQSLYGTFFDRLFGLFVYSPVYILAIIGLIALFRSSRRSDRRLFFAIPLITLPYLALILTFVYWNGLWCPPARYITTLVPMFAAPLAMSLFACNNWIYRIIYGAMGLYGTVVMAFMVADPRRFWPYTSLYESLVGGINMGGDPNSPMIVRLNIWDMLPAVDPLDQRTLPLRTAWMTVILLAALVICYLLMTRWRREVDVARKRLPAVAQGGMWAVTFAVVWASWYFANFDYIQHKTVLTEVMRIGASPPLIAARGLDFMDGKIYVADFEGKQVGVFDVVTSSYSRLQVTDNGVPVSLTRPGDIKRGPDNLLYLLNNGEGDAALYALKPDGAIVRKIALDGKTPVAAGLQFGPDNRMYVADVVGGAILVYNLDGGGQLTRFAGQSSGFNNLLGITITPDGKLYAADSSNTRIQEMDLGGQYLRSITPGCSVFYIANAGDWLDASCPGTGIISINRQTGNQQRITTEPFTAPIATTPTGMVYGPDGALYVIDGNTLVVYKVEH